MGRNHGIRLIDADELKDNIKKWLTVDPTESRLVDIDDIAVSVLMEIDEAPTVDVQPVIHAHWIRIATLGGLDVLKCSNCKSEHIRKPEKYCYDCGAKMDGGDK